MKLRKRQVSGFTLIELLVVVAILVALAGLVLPKLDGVVLKANRGVSANNISGVDRYIQTYRVLHNVYPDGYDSLLDGSGNLPTAATNTDIGLNPELTGSPAPLIHQKLKVASDLTDNNVLSLARIGITTVYDWDASADAPPSGKFVTARTLSSTAKYATLNYDPTSGTGDDDAGGIYNFIYKNHPQDAGAKLIVVGFGRNNTAIGEVLNNAPLYPNSDPTRYYCHFLAIFEARPDNDRAILKCVVGADGDLMQDEMDEYFSQGNAAH